MNQVPGYDILSGDGGCLWGSCALVLHFDALPLGRLKVEAPNAIIFSDGSWVNELVLVCSTNYYHSILVHYDCWVRLSPLWSQITSILDCLKFESYCVKRFHAVQYLVTQSWGLLACRLDHAVVHTTVDVNLVFESADRIVHSMCLRQDRFLYLFLLSAFVTSAIVVEVPDIEKILLLKVHDPNRILDHQFAHAFISLTQIMEHIKLIVDSCSTWKHRPQSMWLCFFKTLSIFFILFPFWHLKGITVLLIIILYLGHLVPILVLFARFSQVAPRLWLQE